MKGFDVLKVKSAVKARNKFDLSHSHLTTMNFGEIVPLFAEETIPGDEFNVSGDYFSRLAPLVKPTYGKFSFKTVAGYVPYHMIAVDAEAFINGKTTWEGQTPHTRFFYLINLCHFLNNSLVSTTTGATATNCDWCYTNSSGVAIYKLWTKEGKYFVKVLNALGYSVPGMVDMQTTSAWYTHVSTERLSAFPLLAFFKLYNDYMSQSQRFNSSTLTTILYSIKYNKAYSGIWNNANGEIFAAGLVALFGALSLNYENDYFTSAWQSPNTPLSSTESINTVPINNNDITSVQGDSFSNYLGIGTGQTELSQRALDFLESFDNWVRRNNYSGSRDVQQVYSRFGIKTDDYRSHYATVITTDIMPIQVGDVTATGPQYISAGDSNNVGLGDYSGKGIMSGGKSFSFKADDFGLLMIFGYFTVTPVNSYGNERKVLRVNPLDFYTPEFDGIGADPISVGEFTTNPIVLTDSVYDTSVFGFTERYNSYRYGRDVLSGEFRNYRNDADMNCWHTGRNVTALRTAGTLLAQNSAVNTLPQVDSEYNRIFSVTDGSIDHFYLTCYFDVSAIRPMMNLNQVPRLGEGDTIVPRNGNVIS